MKSSKNHRMRPGLWLIILLIIVTVGLIFTGISVPMQRTDKSAYDSYNENSSQIVSELGKDLKNTVDVYSDLYNVLVNGEESQYEDGYEALAGRGKKKNASEPDTSEIKEENHSKPIVLGQSDETDNLIEAAVIDVVDGDTIDVKIGETECRIRLIGIDTPESVHSDASRNTVWGNYASEHTKSIMTNIPTVYLEYDKEPTDKYGRTLAYVWLVDDMTDVMYMLNARIVADGYAIDKVFEPNTKYAAQFQSLRKAAQETGEGLWSEEGFVELWQES